MKTRSFNPDTEPSTLLAELAVRTGTSEEALAARLNGEVARDWAGRPCIPAALARRLVEDLEREEAEREQRRAEARAALAEWARKRESFIVERAGALTRELHERWAREAAQAFANREQVAADLRRATPPPPIAAEVRRRVAEELRSWEAKHPKPASPEEVV